MLRWRLLTAAVLIPIIVGSVIWLPPPLFGGVIGLIVMAGAWEWTRLIPIYNTPYRLVFVGLTGLTLWACSNYLLHGIGTMVILSIGVAWWITALTWICRPALMSAPTAASSAWKSLGGILTLVPPWFALMSLKTTHPRGAYLILTLFALVWVADSAAYFAGKRWGRRPLAPIVSPGKTWEGILGALFAGIIVAYVGGVILSDSALNRMFFLTLALLTIMFSVVGDLLESLMKRHSGLKDSGGILPGHGGVLDRVDSITSAAPIFTFGVLWAGL